MRCVKLNSESEKFAERWKSNVSNLPCCLKARHSDGRRKIEAPDVGVSFDPEHPIGKPINDRLRQPFRFAPEDQDISLLIGHVQIIARCESRKQPVVRGRKLRLKIVKVLDRLPLKVLPIIKTGSTHGFLSHLKTQGLHQPELCLKRHTGATNGPSIRRNLRLMQNDMQGRFVFQNGSVTTQLANNFYKVSIIPLPIACLIIHKSPLSQKLPTCPTIGQG